MIRSIAALIKIIIRIKRSCKLSSKVVAVKNLNSRAKATPTGNQDETDRQRHLVIFTSLLRLCAKIRETRKYAHRTFIQGSFMKASANNP